MQKTFPLRKKVLNTKGIVHLKYVFQIFKSYMMKSDPIFSNPQDISEYDSELWDSLQLEEQRQEEHIELIASENYTSQRILDAQGSILTNKYAEGYPSKRYYGGCEHVDLAENLAIERAKNYSMQIMQMFESSFRVIGKCSSIFKAY